MNGAQKISKAAGWEAGCPVSWIPGERGTPPGGRLYPGPGLCEPAYRLTCQEVPR